MTTTDAALTRDRATGVVSRPSFNYVLSFLKWTLMILLNRLFMPSEACREIRSPSLRRFLLVQAAQFLTESVNLILPAGRKTTERSLLLSKMLANHPAVNRAKG